MTNIDVIVTVWINMVTNPAPAGYTTNGAAFYQVSKVSTINQYLADGSYLNWSTMNHFDFVTNNPPPSPPAPPLTPPSRARERLRRPGSASAPLPLPRSTTLFQFSPQVANGGTDNLENFNPMFKTWFTTNTNMIYRLEGTFDSVNWVARPPEIDGTGSSEYFFDALSNQPVFYRIAARSGVLPQ